MSSKYKRRNPYRPLAFALGVARAAEACPDWRMVVACGTSAAGPWWSELRAEGARFTHSGEAPVQSGVVCDAAWRPVRVETRTGRVLPALAEAWEEDPS